MIYYVFKLIYLKFSVITFIILLTYYVFNLITRYIINSLSYKHLSLIRLFHFNITSEVPMRALFFTTKGGHGKTTHSVSYTKHRDALYITNDYESGTIEIYSDMFAENQLQKIKPEDKIDFESLKHIDDIVFDFGGWVDDKIKTIAQNVDVIVIPLFYQSIADLIPCIKTVKSLAVYNKNIVILINNTEKEYLAGLEKELKKQFPEFKVLVVNKSKYINKLADEGVTISDLFKKGGIAKFHLKKYGLTQQITDLYKYMDGINA